MQVVQMIVLRLIGLFILLLAVYVLFLLGLALMPITGWKV